MQNVLHTLGLLGLLIVLTALSPNFFRSWNITDDYSVRFSGRGAEGTFKGLQGSIAFDPTNLANARMDVSVDVKTISTGNNTKNKHARGDSWFDAEKYPQIKFRSKRFVSTGDSYQVTGDLTLHGTTKEVQIPFSFEESNSGGIFIGQFKIDREEYGIKGPLVSFMVGDEFTVDLRVPVQPK